MACLTLVAPSGMTAGEREQWLEIAWQTVKYLPADILQAGCEAARRKCKFPSEVVPTIIESTRQRMLWRTQDAAQIAAPQAADGPADPWIGEQMKRLLGRLKN